MFQCNTGISSCIFRVSVVGLAIALVEKGGWKCMVLTQMSQYMASLFGQNIIGTDALWR